MAFHLLGLDIILTDIAPVIPALKRKLKCDKPALGKLPKMAQLYLQNPKQLEDLKRPFDFVIAADVVYIEESAGHLVSAMETLLSSTGVVLLEYQLRSLDAYRKFWEFCEWAFVAEKFPHEDLHPDYAYEQTDVYIMKKK